MRICRKVDLALIALTLVGCTKEDAVKQQPPGAQTAETPKPAFNTSADRRRPKKATPAPAKVAEEQVTSSTESTSSAAKTQAPDLHTTPAVAAGPQSPIGDATTEIAAASELLQKSEKPDPERLRTSVRQSRASAEKRLQNSPNREVVLQRYAQVEQLLQDLTPETDAAVIEVKLRKADDLLQDAQVKSASER